MTLFTLWDYLAVASVLIISTGIGVFYGLASNLRTKAAYLLADGKMSSWPVAFSLMASCISATTLLGLPQESYQFGIGYAWLSISYIIATPLMAYSIFPVFYKMRVTSVYEYFEKRFGYATRLVTSISYFLQIILLLGVALYAPATMMVTVTGISRTTAIIAIGFVVTFYSTVGGMKAILFTDVFQALLMFGGIYSVVISSILNGHGIEEIWKTAQENDRVYWPSLEVNPTIRFSCWALIFGGLSLFLGQFVGQMQVQRLMAVKSLTGAQSAIWWNLPLLVLLTNSSLFGGLVIFNFYKDCDPLLEGRVTDRAQLLPLFVIDTMKEYPGLPGLFVSGLFCGCLSTLSSASSALSAVAVEDFIGKFYEKVLKKPLETNSSLLAKTIVCAIGIVAVMLALLYDDTTKGLIEVAMTIIGCAGSPVLGLFILGLFTVKSNQRGGLIGLVVGLGVACSIGFSKSKPAPVMLPLTDIGCEGHNSSRVVEILSPKEEEYFYLFKISFLWLPTLGCLLTIVIGYVCSVILEKLNLANNDTIYLDASRSRINFKLFSPLLSAYLRRKASAKTAEISDCERRLNTSEF